MKLLVSVFFCFFCTLHQTLAYEFGSFYTTIAETTKNYDADILTVKHGESLGKALNEKLGKTCFEEDLSEETFFKIRAADTQALLDALTDDCKSENALSQSLYLEITSASDALYRELVNEAKSTTTAITTLTKSDIYSDGSLENSPFDLMEDIEKIDEIIFERSEEMSYTPTKTTDLAQKLKEKLKDQAIDQLQDDIKDAIGRQIQICKLGNCDEDTLQARIDALIAKSGNTNIVQTLSSGPMCEVNESGLDDTTDAILKNSIESKKNTPEVSVGDDGYELNNPLSDIKKIASDYKKTNDNKLFPCNDFLCVKVDFNTYSHNLLGGWVREYPSIEFLLKRANEHLKPLVAGSLVQSKMTLNNFELGLKDIDLPNQFHMGLQISTRPVPILDVVGKEKKYKGELAYENQLQAYYEATGLNYEYANDLSLLLNYKADSIATENAKFLNPSAAFDDIKDFRSTIDANYDKIRVIEDAIELETNNQGLSYFSEQYQEVEVFNKSMREYVESLDTILDGYLQTPVDTGAN